MKTAEAVENFLTSRLTRNCASSTLKWYRLILEPFADMYPEITNDENDIERFISSLPGKDERRHGYFRALKAFYRFLNRRYKITNPICNLDPPRRKKKLPKALSLENFIRLLHYNNPPDIEAFLMFIADTGCRVGELSNLKPEDIERIPGGHVCLLDGKTGQHYVPIGDKTYSEIIKYIPLQYQKAWLGRRISRAFKDAGVKGTAHNLRHTFATLWEGSEFALKDILGHSNFQILANYRHLRMKQIAEQHRQYSPLNLLKGDDKW